MTISTTNTLNRYTGNGSTVVFPYTYRILAATDLVVTKRAASALVETTLAYPGDYSVSGVGNATGGSITLNSAPLSGDILSIRRVLPITQSTSIRNNGSYFAETHENVFDRQTMVDQQHEEALSRTFALPSTLDPASYDMDLPVPSTGQVLVWGPTGLTNGSVASGNVVLPGAGRTTNTLTTYLANNYIYNVLDYEADPTGASDSTAAIQTAINAADPNGATPGTVYFPYGLYSITNLTLPAYTVLFGAGMNLPLLRARVGTSGTMITENGSHNATGIRIIGMLLDGFSQSGLNGIKLGYAGGGPGGASFNFGAFLKDVGVRNCPGTAIDLQGNVAELEDVWAEFGNGTGIRLNGIAMRATRIASQQSSVAEIEIGADGSQVDQLHIETTINKPVKFLAGCDGSRINGLSLTVSAGTIPTLIEFDAAAKGCAVRDISVNLDAGGSDYTSLISDLFTPLTLAGTSLFNKRYGGTYHQEAHIFNSGAPISAEQYRVNGVTVIAGANKAGTSADRGDTSQTLTVGTDNTSQRWATALTANRTVTLSGTGAFNGAKFRVVRTGLGAFTLDVGGLKTIPNATAAFVDVEYDGAAWRLAGYGTL